jgi:hypothetical protein
VRVLLAVRERKGPEHLGEHRETFHGSRHRLYRLPTSRSFAEKEKPSM